MQSLSQATLTATLPGLILPGYDRAKLKPGIVQIGVGNFHRTHLAVYVDRCLHLPGHEDWGILGIGLGNGPGAAEKAADYAAQDGLYTVTEYDPSGSVSSRVIGAMIGYVHGAAEPERALSALAAPEAKIISLTITEGGYNIAEKTGQFDLSDAAVQADLSPQNPPRTVFRFVVQAMQRRRDSGAGPVTILSCDNLRSNGAVARKAFMGFAEAYDPATAAWMAANVSFPDGMVDRIAPSVGPAEIAKANALSGVNDRVPAIAESFIQWVTEDDFIAGRPDFAAVGVQLRPDVKAFETIKGRMLNASHMMMSFPSLLLGHRLVDKAVADPRISRLMLRFLNEVAMPLLAPPSDVSLTGYRDMIVERFSNPAVGDQVLRIAHDGLSKLPIFLSATTRAVLEAGTDPSILAFHMACFRAYFGGRDDNGDEIIVNEPHLAAVDVDRVRSDDPLVFLEITPFAPLGLGSNAKFRDAYLHFVALIASGGGAAAIDDLLGRG